ncbi:MAG TPA: ribosome biogenesis GTPase Der [Thermoanaerobaculia bacterium]|nr:ribosome biogenesis GTPase Der [Thermoanaerobaculia bacterium]
MPTVSIIGRPNVGKSTLFNRLVGRRRAIVHDLPGVTRDRIVGEADVGIDHRLQLVDTGGLAPDAALGLNEQVLLAVEESDLLLLVVDGKEGLTSADRAVWEQLRRYDKPTQLVVNKADTRHAREGYGEFYALGIPTVHLVSAEHGAGVEDLREALSRALPESLPRRAEAPAVAIVGRPNVGKSSLLNRIVGEPRVLVSPEPGTTRDPIDTLIRRHGKDYLLIDTAGIRRRSRVSGTPEELAVMMARRQLERADVALLVLDAAAGVTTGDLSIAGTAWELGRGVVVAVNKWDLLDDDRRQHLERGWERLEQLLAAPRRVNVSAATGRGVGRIFGPLDETLAAFRRQFGTGEVNRLFEQAVTEHQPPSLQGRPWKLFYATQVATGPPTFMLFANRPLPRHHAYRRYLENRLRQTLGLEGVPVRLVVRKRQ